MNILIDGIELAPYDPNLITVCDDQVPTFTIVDENPIADDTHLAAINLLFEDHFIRLQDEG